MAVGNSSPARSIHSASPVASPQAVKPMSPLAIVVEDESPEQEQDDEKVSIDDVDDDDDHHKPNNNNNNNNNNNKQKQQSPTTKVLAVASADSSRDDENSRRDGDDDDHDDDSPSHNNTGGVHVQRVSSGASTRSRFGWNNQNNNQESSRRDNNNDNDDDDYMFSESDSKQGDRGSRSSPAQEKGVGKDHKQGIVDEKEDEYGMETVFSGVLGRGGGGSSGRPAVAPRASWDSSPSPAKGITRYLLYIKMLLWIVFSELLGHNL